MANPTRKQVSAWLTVADFKRLKVYAINHDTTVKEVVRKAIEQYIKDNK